VLHESRDQAALFAPLARAVFTPRTPAEVAGVLDAAVAAAMRRPRGPVYLDIPADVLGQPAEPLARADRLARARPRAGRLGRRRGGAAGAAGRDLGGRRRRRRGAVAERVGRPHRRAGGVDVPGPRLPPTDHPLALGLPPHEPEAAELIGAADVLLAVGGDLDGMNTRNWSMPRPPALVTIDPAAVEQPEWAPDAAVTGKLGEALRGLVDRLPEPRRRGPHGHAAASARPLAADPTTGEAVALVAAVESGPHPGHRAGRATWRWPATGRRYAGAPGPRRLAYPVGWGTLGLRAAGGDRPGLGRAPVLAVCGDGG
jgi:acetolactate synthase-1/2/3 large subunit